MNKEIKEILDLFGSTDENIMFCDIVELNSKQSHLLLDYITNLQQRIEGLEAENETLRSDFKNQVEYTNKIAEEKEDYKSRCEKAIEYIEKFIPIDNDTILMREAQRDYLLNILQNGSEEK